MRQVNMSGYLYMLKPLTSLRRLKTDFRVLSEIQQLFVRTVVLALVYYIFSEINRKKNHFWPVSLLLKSQGVFQSIK